MNTSATLAETISAHPKRDTMARHRLGLSLVFGLCVTSSYAATTDALSELRDRALNDQTAWQVLESLTTEVGPRMAGSSGDIASVTWAQAKFKALGFDKIYTEAVMYPVWERGPASCDVLAPFPQSLSIAALGGSMGTGKTPVQADVVMFQSFADLQKAQANAAAGKIVFINQSTERSKNGSGYGASVIARVAGASAAAKLGAKALLIRSIGTDRTSRTPHTGVMRYDNTPTRIPAAALSNVDADLLTRMLERGKPVRLKLALQARTLKAMHKGANVIGEITGHSQPDEIVAIGGHLDSWDLGTGAIDDGAGVAMTMAAASLIGQRDKAPKRTIRVVLFANEEQGVYGGKAYAAARALDKTVSKHQIAAESDFGAGRIYELSLQLPNMDQQNLAPLFDVLKPLGISRGPDEATGSADFSPLRELGAPVADLKQDGTNYFDIHHTANDTLDKVEPAALQQNVAAWAVLALFFADR